MNKAKQKQFNKERRRLRVNVQGTFERPRLSVFRSLLHIYVQVIDDTKGVTLASANDRDLDVSTRKGKTKSEIALEVGKLIAQRAQEKNIKMVVFDKGSFLYHGRVKMVADGAREGGLQF